VPVNRPLRYSLLLTSFLSSTLFVAILVLWFRSHRGPDYVHYVSENQWSLSLISGHGTLDVLYLAHWPQEPEFRRGRYDPYVYYGTRYGKRFVGFGTDVSPSGGRYVNIPHWFLAAVSLFFAAWTVRIARRRRRFPPGHCARCGYDLRASPERCPECGATPATSR
jgi:hypothetical protein